MAENVNETVMSVIENPTAIDENALKTQTIDLEVRADALVVTNDEEYQDAAVFLKVLKDQAGKVKDFFKPWPRRNTAPKGGMRMATELSCPWEGVHSTLQGVSFTAPVPP